MSNPNGVLGIHHVTAICGEPQANVDFYAGALGLRTVKVTVNHDDVKTYHLYYGTGDARPGSFITFFPWPYAYRGIVGNGQSTVTAYSVPQGSLEFWLERATTYQIHHEDISTRWGDRYLRLRDPDGATVELVEAPQDPREPSPWLDLSPDKAILGFHSVLLTVPKLDKIQPLLTDQMGYRLLESDANNRHRFIVNEGHAGEIIDVLVDDQSPFGRDGVGTTHHVAFRTTDDNHQLALRQDIEQAGLHITPQIDRHYFHSLYFRTPAGPLFEIATDPPGMTYDEPLESLGTTLVFPDHAIGREEEIRRGLTPFTTPDGVAFP